MVQTNPLNHIKGIISIWSSLIWTPEFLALIFKINLYLFQLHLWVLNLSTPWGLRSQSKHTEEKKKVTSGNFCCFLSRLFTTTATLQQMQCINGNLTAQSIFFYPFPKSSGLLSTFQMNEMVYTEHNTLQIWVIQSTHWGQMSVEKACYLCF